ncbi:Origin recognition complex subunit 5 [Lachnellula arida]|uniref:Origin recognition complex subunit 5 n=1 Tax=Lachnellula arida TaxID=1316785 RepID=A0A8T9B0P2_9HELO|nr:Origin recognition complex subunit 5 [Lachnellula arida]
MASMFSLPTAVVLTSIVSQFPCREQQIRSLATLLAITGAPSRNIVLYGLEATGKSAITKAILQGLSAEPDKSLVNGDSDVPHDQLRYAVIKSAECITGRHLLEQAVGAVAKAVNWEGNGGRCENVAQLVVELGRMLEGWRALDDGATNRRIVLVFDGIDHQREAPPTLLPSLARLGEIIPNLTILYIITAPRPNFLHLTGVPHIHFPSYTKPELLQIISSTPPTPQLPGGAKETQETWSRFTSAVYDSLSKHSGRDILSFRSISLRLWPRFIKPILDGQLSSTPFSRLLVANRSLFQNETVLIPGIISEPPLAKSGAVVQGGNESKGKYQGIATQLPYYSRLLLVASYLASFNPPRLDILHFMKSASSKRRKKGGGTALSRSSNTKRRSISRKLLGPQAFVLERMLAIFHCIKEDADSRGRYRNANGNGNANERKRENGSADIQMAIATLASLRLLVKMGAQNAGDAMDGACRYRVAVGWEVVRGVARSVGVEAEDYLAD